MLTSKNNKCVKGDGGAIGLTENSTQLRRWMIAGPEVARLVNEFQLSTEASELNQLKVIQLPHHEQTKADQTKFKKEVLSLCETVEEMGNPFTEQTHDLMVLNTRDIVDPSIAETVQQIEDAGKQQYNRFVIDRLDNRTTPLSEPIKRNKFPLFSCRPPRKVSVDKQKIAALKQNCSLFSQLYVSCQVRSGDMDAFFTYENQKAPPSLSQNETLRQGSKSDLLDCLEPLSSIPVAAPSVDAILLDGAAVVNFLQPGGVKTFEEYSQQIFLPYIRTQLGKVNHVEMVWDVYLPNSLKATAQNARGKGTRRRVQPKTQLPKDWASFLRVDENKTEIFAYLAEQSISWEPYWTSLPQASKTCRELIKCGCDVSKGCRARCKCVRSDLQCTALCTCGGECVRDNAGRR